MNQPFVGDMFYGNPEGAWNNYRGTIEPIRTRNGVTLARCRRSAPRHPNFIAATRDQHAFQSLRKAVKLMRYGGDAYFFSVLAAGHLDIALDAGLQAYDIGALIPIIEGAGGACGSWTGSNPPKVATSLVAGF